MVKWMPKGERCERDTRTHVRHPPKGMKKFEIILYTTIINEVQ